MSQQYRLNILLADDDEHFRRQFTWWLTQKGGHLVSESANTDEAWAAFQEGKWDLAIIDYYLEGEQFSDGLSLLEAIHHERPDFPVVVITGVDRSIGREALQKGAFWYLEKPIDRLEAELILSHLAQTQARRAFPREEKRVAAWVALSHAIVSAPNAETLKRVVEQKAPAFLGADESQLILLHGETLEPQGNGKGKLRKEVLRRLKQSEDGFIFSHADKDGTLAAVFCTFPEMAAEDIPSVNPNNKGRQRIVSPAAVLYTRWHGRQPETDKESLKANLKALGQLLGGALRRIKEKHLLESVVEGGKELLQAKTSEEIFDIVREALRGPFEASTFYLALYDQEKEKISFPLLCDEGQKISVSPLPLDRGGLAGYIIRTQTELSVVASEGKPLRAPDGTVAHHHGKPSRSFFGVPLRVGARTLGALSIQRYTPRPFGIPAKQALRSLAATVSLSLDRLQKEQRISDIIQGLLSNPLEDTLKTLALQIREDIGGDIITIHVYDPQRHIFLPARIRLGLQGKQAGKPFCDAGSGALQQLIELSEGEHYTSDATHDPVFSGEFQKKYNVRACGGVVLKMEGHLMGMREKLVPVGVAVVNFRETHIFSEKEKQRLRSLGKIAAQAVGAAFLLQKERRRQNRRLLLHEMGELIKERVNRVATVGQLQKELATAVAKALPRAWDDVLCSSKVVPSILFAAPGRDRLTFPPDILGNVYKINVKGEEKRKEIRFGEGICGWVATRKQPYLAQDTLNDPQYLPLRTATRAELAVPILFGDSLLGVLDVEAEQPYFFTEEDRLFLEDVARELAIALGAMGQRDVATQVLAAVQRVASNAARPEDALRALAEEAHRLASEIKGKATTAAVFLKTSDGLVPMAAYPTDGLQRLKETRPVFPLVASPGKRRGIVVRAAMERQSQRVRDVSQDKDYVQYNPDTRAELDVPIFSAAGEVIGVLNVEYSDPAALDYADQQILESLAAQGALVMALQQQVQALQEQQVARDIAASMAVLGIAAADYGHTWKNDVASFHGTLNLIYKSWEKICTRRWRRKLATAVALLGLLPGIGKTCKYLKRLQRLEDKLKESKLISPPNEKMEEVMLRPFLEKRMARWRERYVSLEEKEMEFQSALNALDDAKVRANVEWLGRAFDNLLSNAARAAARGGRQPRVTLRGEQHEHMAVITIEDNGMGIPEAVRPYLFVGLVPQSLATGHGAGGLISSFVFRFYDGKVYVDESSAKGTAIVVELPLLA